MIFRPHPYTDRRPEHRLAAADIVALLADDARRTGRRHRFGAGATQETTLVDCFNAADLLVSDVSSVVPDFLYSEKPFLITAMQGTVAEFGRAFPISRAAYVLDRRGRNVDRLLDSVAGGDPVAAERRRAKRYFLGDLGDENPSDVFVREARALVAAS